jgi:hypothetical protein
MSPCVRHAALCLAPAASFAGLLACAPAVQVAATQPAAVAPAPELSEAPAQQQGLPRAIVWHPGPSLPQGRDHHAVFSAVTGGGEFLYVAAGTDYQGLFSDVWRLRISAQGPVGEWEEAGSLPAGVAGHSVAVAPGLAVLVGGQDAGGRRIATVLTAAIGEDGSLGAWRPGPELPRPAFHHPALYHEGWVYVVGGQGARTSEASVFAVPVVEGGLGDWVELTALPRPRSHHSAFVHEGELYVVGGADGHPAAGNALYLDVWRAPISADGTLGPWRRRSVMPQAYATHSSFVHAGHLYTIGGVENDQTFTDVVLRTRLDDAGLVGRWERVADSLPRARAHVHETPVHHGRIYSVGGSNARRVSDELHVGWLTASPEVEPR